MSEDEGSYQVVTANLLRGGEIVYMTLDAGRAGWSAKIHYAHVFEEGWGQEMLALAKADEDDNIIVSAYLIEVTGASEPLSERERIRAKGPTIAFGEDAIAANKTGYSI